MDTNESFEKPQIQNSLRRTLKEIFFENRSYSKSSNLYNIMRYLSGHEEKKALDYIAKAAEVAKNATCE